MSKLKIDRTQLASSIEYAATNKLAKSEWDRFFINHYEDEKMESARKAVVKIMMSHSENNASKECMDKLFLIAKGLRLE